MKRCGVSCLGHSNESAVLLFLGIKIRLLVLQHRLETPLLLREVTISRKDINAKEEKLGDNGKPLFLGKSQVSQGP